MQSKKDAVTLHICWMSLPLPYFASPPLSNYRAIYVILADQPLQLQRPQHAKRQQHELSQKESTFSTWLPHVDPDQPCNEEVLHSEL